MREQPGVSKLASKIHILSAVGIAALGIGLFVNSQAVSQGVRQGLSVCSGMLIPALFPFMVLAGFLTFSDYGRILSIPLKGITTHIFKLPEKYGTVILLSLIGGYPVGARMISDLLDSGEIDSATASRMLCFCVNSGPSFLISAVGAGLFLDKTVGIILFASQTLTTLMIGWAVSLKVPLPSRSRRVPSAAGTLPSFIKSVDSAVKSMINMCGFAVLFSALLSMLLSGGVMLWFDNLFPSYSILAQAIISGLFEVTSGCIAASRIGGAASFAMTSAIVSFGGLSVLFQIMSCFSKVKMNLQPFLLSRIAHMIIATALSLPAYLFFCGQIPVWSPAMGIPPAFSDAKTMLLTSCLMAMSTIFILSFANLGTGKNK